jgi:hypothetical protein
MQASRLYWWVTGLALGMADRARGEDHERGDVPGWVMVTLMSAILVVAILVPFRRTVLPAIQGAINSVIDLGKN